MGINFAAANMAGYNNPQIEVFTAVLDEKGTSLAQYQDKSIILNCLNRGSIPVIILSAFVTGGYLLILSEWDSSETGTTITFSTPASTSGSTKIQIIYPESNENPPRVVIE